MEQQVQSEQDNLEYLAVPVQYPLANAEMLAALVGLKTSKTFGWLVLQLDTEADSAEKVVLFTMPTDLGGCLAREQAIGFLRGVQRLMPLVDEHIAELTKRVRNG